MIFIVSVIYVNYEHILKYIYLYVLLTYVLLEYVYC